MNAVAALARHMSVVQMSSNAAHPGPSPRLQCCGEIAG